MKPIPSPHPPDRIEAHALPASLLVVEAEPMMRYILLDVLERSLPGVYIHEAASAARALHLMESCHPRIVLLDFRLHDADAVEFTRLVTARHPKTAIVMLSAFHAEADERAARAAGAADYVTKDRLFTDLVPAIDRVLRGHRDEQAA